MPDPVYFGGTVERSVTSQDIVAGVQARGRRPTPSPSARPAATSLVELARPGDRIVIMGARDDTLALFAADLVERLGSRPEEHDES